MNNKLLTEHHLEFLSLKGGCIGSSESINVKMPHCWKSDVAAQMGYIHEKIVTTPTSTFARCAICYVWYLYLCSRCKMLYFY